MTGLVVVDSSNSHTTMLFRLDDNREEELRREFIETIRFAFVRVLV